jgi:retron-type reverse transcriptase
VKPVGIRGEDAPVESGGLLEQVVERSNLFTALSRVKRNGGSPGIDGMSVKALPEHLKRRWPEIRESLLPGSCGFRPGRSAQQAVAQAQRYLGMGFSWVVDLDLDRQVL